MPLNRPVRTTTITVAYNSAEIIGEMLASLPLDVPCVVVDNASTDNSADIALKAGSNVIRIAKNEGFGRGCNIGAAKATTEFLFFLNPDATLGAECIARLEAAADTYAFASAFNPAIKGKDGSNFFRRGSRLLARSKWMPRGQPAADCEVPVLTGAALFCRRAQFEQIGGYDEAIFLYHEDDDLSLRLSAAFGPLMFIHGANVGHQGGQSSSHSLEVARIKSYERARSRIYALTKHGLPHAFGKTFISALSKFINPAVLFSAIKRAQAVAFLKGTVSMLSTR